MNWFKTWLVKRQHATKFRIEYNNGELVMKVICLIAAKVHTKQWLNLLQCHNLVHRDINDVKNKLHPTLSCMYDRGLLLEVGRHIENIVDISPIWIYQHFRYRVFDISILYR